MSTQTNAHTQPTLSHARILVECALMVAIGTVLMMIKLFSLPNGGSITPVSMLPFIIISFRHGAKWGMLTGLAFSLLQMITGWYAPPAGTIPAYFGMVLLDYLVAFTMLGTASIFAKPLRNRLAGIIFGTTVVCLIRFLCSFLSGFLIWGSIVTDGIGAVIYSFTYNASYMLPETFLTVLAAILLYKTAPTIFKQIHA